MKTDFFTIQSAETRRIQMAAAIVFAVYFVAIWIPCLVVMAFVAASDPHWIARSAGLSALLSFVLLASQVWYARSHGVDAILESLSAHKPDPEDHYHQRAITLLEELCVAAGGLRAQLMIVPTHSANAFALADGRRRIVGVTEGVVSRFSRAQTQAILAHELAHIVNQDCRLATFVCAMAAPFVALSDALETMSAEDPADRGGSLYVGAAKGTISLLSIFLSRRREIRADAKAIELTRDPAAMAEALVRIQRMNHFLGGPGESLSPIFIVPSVLRAVNERETLAAQWLSTHPPFEKRLGLMLAMAHLSREEAERRAGVDAPFENRGRGRAAAPAGDLRENLAAKQRWRIQDRGEWKGPFGLDELLNLAIFGPNAWILPEGANSSCGMPALADPLLAGFFRRQSQANPAAMGDCPLCKVALASRIYEGLPVGQCSSCGGIFADEKRVRRLLGRREKRFSPEFRQRAETWLRERYFVNRREPPRQPDAKQARACPSCRKPLYRCHYSYQYFIEVDRCLECRRIWFDAEKLELLQALVERSQDRGDPRP